MKLAQATGLCGGMLVPRTRYPPRLRRRSRLGSLPAFINCPVRRGSMPSMPITITRVPAAAARRWVAANAGAAPMLDASAAAAHADCFIKSRLLMFFIDSLRSRYAPDAAAPLPPPLTVSGRPSMWAGTATPNRSSTVGPMSISPGRSSSIIRLQKSTPGTSDRSMQ